LLLNLLDLILVIRMKSYRKFWNVVDKNQLKDGWVEGGSERVRDSHGHMARGGHGLHKFNLRPPSPMFLLPADGPPLK
jgi:hypothetical protein